MWKRQGQASSHWNKQAISQCQWTFKLHVSPAQVFQTFKIVQNIWANFLWSQPCVGGPGQGYRNCFLPFDGMDKRLLVPKSAAAGKAHAETQRTISLALLSSNACLMGLSADTCDKQGTMQKSWWSGRNWRSIYCNYVASLLQCAHIQLTGCCTIYYWNLCRSKSLELCEANEAETTDKCLKQARITHPSLMSTPRAKKELGWRRQAMLHRREATNCHGPLGIFFLQMAAETCGSIWTSRWKLTRSRL